MKSDKYLLELLLASFEETPFLGLCMKTNFLWKVGRISVEEEQHMDSLIESYKPLAIEKYGAEEDMGY